MTCFALHCQSSDNALDEVLESDPPARVRKMQFDDFLLRHNLSQAARLAFFPTAMRDIDMSQQQEQRLQKIVLEVDEEIDYLKKYIHEEDQYRSERRRQRTAKQREYESRIEELQSSLGERIQAELRPDQIKRLIQIDLQLRGGLALHFPSVQDALELSDLERGLFAQPLRSYLAKCHKLDRQQVVRIGDQEVAAFRQAITEFGQEFLKDSLQVLWCLAILFPAGPIIYMSQFAFMNVYLFFTWQDPYDKQPETFLAVVVILGVLVAPGLAIYWFLARDWRRLKSVLLAQSTEAIAQ